MRSEHEQLWAEVYVAMRVDHDIVLSYRITGTSNLTGMPLIGGGGGRSQSFLVLSSHSSKRITIFYSRY